MSPIEEDLCQEGVAVTPGEFGLGWCNMLFGVVSQGLDLGTAESLAWLQVRPGGDGVKLSMVRGMRVDFPCLSGDGQSGLDGKHVEPPPVKTNFLTIQIVKLYNTIILLLL